MSLTSNKKVIFLRITDIMIYTRKEQALISIRVKSLREGKSPSQEQFTLQLKTSDRVLSQKVRGARSKVFEAIEKPSM